MDRRLRTVVWGLLLVGCGASGGSDAGSGGGGDAGAIATECVTYCEGAYACGSAALSAGCSLTLSQPAFQTSCEDTCRRGAATMTDTQVAQAIACLHCLDGFVDQSSCTGTGLMDAGTSFVLGDAVASCGAVCMTDGVMTINAFVSRDFFNPDGGSIVVCPDAGP